MSWLFASDGQSIGVSALESVLPVYIQVWFLLGLTGLISFRMDWLDLFALQGTLKSLLQHHSSKASVLWCSASFMVQLLHPYMTNGKTIALTIQTFVGKESLLCNMLSSFVSFPSKNQASFNIMATVTICTDFGVQESKICHIVLLANKLCFHFIPIYLPWSDGTYWHDLGFLNVGF